ncbi:uncharacterized protein LOC124846746 [Vigna umbellata]|uniref:Uncharacterized protein n=2 Tax=Phaseolus angularis TaxID=3914 RepID=A0A0L9TN35_PHAAN|nr:uncharacterized protein LOC108333941 [Vigna angularis]XP_047180038.1 uncharacterized protein LOC124846745 [Vigna umbellata]XP_047180039.1 uncharacterized protein LOC124846746 [Vigna umbellata]BAT75146.1 hypothetical protein VIGAN_01296000 [Vigna angularis var. angularis]KAG2409020.1 uncharacterized protein HKW66_Vig0038420 [Vigna angularis]KOM31973.1 hypothetical protein LR48_Vigan01g152900 [Vigna angularis]
MVLWEITLATAYFLGIKRTYKLALRIQRRILAPKIRQFVHRRTRSVFNVALKVNRTIQERDITFGRNMGNYILQRLNRMKPQAQTQGGSPSNGAPRPSLRMTKLVSSFSNSKTSSYYQLFKRKSGIQNTWFQKQSIWSKPFPSIVTMMRPQSLAGTSTHCRHLTINASHAFRPNYRVNWPGDVIRKDIMQWMLRS